MNVESERPPGVTTGVDRSVGARDAARWAAAEAARLNEPLRVLHVTSEAAQTAAGDDTFEVDAVRSGWTLVDEVVAELSRLQPSVKVSGEVLTGSARRVLGDLAAVSGICVVGARSTGGFADLLLGSTAEHVAQQASWRAVIVRGDRRPGPGLPVVLAVDDSAPALAAAGYAFEQADHAGASVIAIHSSDQPVELLDYYGFGPTLSRLRSVNEDAGVAIAGLLEPLTARFPDVTLDLKVFGSGAPMHVLRFAHDAGLVVTGSRGHHPLSRALVGSVSRQILQYSSCTVAVVHR